MCVSLVHIRLIKLRSRDSLEEDRQTDRQTDQPRLLSSLSAFCSSEFLCRLTKPKNKKEP